MKTLNSLTMVVFLFLAFGCASIVSKSSYPVPITSNPSGAMIVVVDGNNQEVFRGKTPATVNLKAGGGYFKKARYRVRFTKEGYDEVSAPLDTKVDGWYWGNLVFGGLLGFLVIDPATGSMYKFANEQMAVQMTPATTGQKESKLRIYSIDEIPSEWSDQLVPLP